MRTARQVIGQRHRRDLPARALAQRVGPAADRVLAVVRGQERWSGTMPHQAPKCAPLLNCLKSSTVATAALAPTKADSHELCGGAHIGVVARLLRISLVGERSVAARALTPPRAARP
jgi:hypothetical protein